MKIAVCLGLALLVTSCSAGTPQPESPEGWAVKELPSCCRISIPADATLIAGENLIDNAGYELKGQDFEGLFIVTQMATGLPPASSGAGYKAATFVLDRRTARTASYTVANSPLPERRRLLWTFSGRDDGHGENLILDFSCRGSGCEVFTPMIRSLQVRD